MASLLACCLYIPFACSTDNDLPHMCIRVRLASFAYPLHHPSSIIHYPSSPACILIIIMFNGDIFAVAIAKDDSDTMQRMFYAVTALVPGHSASTDASNRRTQFVGLLYSCVQPASAYCSSPGRHSTQARCNSRRLGNSGGVPFACFLNNLQNFLGFR